MQPNIGLIRDFASRSKNYLTPVTAAISQSHRKHNPAIHHQLQPTNTQYRVNPSRSLMLFPTKDFRSQFHQFYNLTTFSGRLSSAHISDVSPILNTCLTRSIHRQGTCQYKPRAFHHISTLLEVCSSARAASSPDFNRSHMQQPLVMLLRCPKNLRTLSYFDLSKHYPPTQSLSWDGSVSHYVEIPPHAAVD